MPAEVQKTENGKNLFHMDAHHHFQKKYFFLVTCALPKTFIARVIAFLSRLVTEA